MQNMKTLVEKNTNVSIHLWHDTYAVTMDENGYVVNENEQMQDFNSNTADIVLAPEVPDDWMGGRYMFVNNEWHANPNWIDPNIQ